jgi:hypothetical protein
MRIRAACLGALLVCVSVSGCATSRSDFVVALPNGYQIKRGGNAAEPMIVKKSGGTVVPGPVVSYTVIRDVVVGRVQSAQAVNSTSSAAAQPAEKTGYFVLETRTGALGRNLSETEYNARLKSLGLPPAPELSPPVLPR